MKFKAFALIPLMDTLVAFTVFSLSYRVFTHNRIYSIFLTFLNAFFSLSQISKIVMFGSLLTVVFILVLSGSFSKIFYLSWILFTPSALWFSKLDWLQIMKFPLNFEIFATDLSFTEVFYTGLALISCKIFLFFSSQVRKTRLELLNRGASEIDVERVILKQFIFSSTLVIICTAITFSIASSAPFLKTFLLSWTKHLPYPYLVLGSAATITLAICLLIYLKTQTAQSEGAIK